MKYFLAGTNQEIRFLSAALYKRGFQVTNNDSEASFILASDTSSTCKNTSLPCIIISSSDVYASVEGSGDVDPTPFSEERSITLPSTKYCLKQAFAVQEEALLRHVYTDHAVLRVFDVYGMGLNSVVSNYINVAKQHGQFSVDLSPYRKTSCLYASDFEEMFFAFLSVFLQGGIRGVYNLGSPTPITYKHLAESVLSALGRTEKPEILVVESPKYYVNWYSVPDMVRFSAITGTTPKVSLRKGLWQELNYIC